MPVNVPNAFSPNGDGINDTWHIEGLESYRNAHVQIFNRWGARVYKKYGFYVPWDGYSKGGLELPQATYYYVIELNDDDKTVYRGDVSILR